jgi:hypothetical protein
LLKKPDMPSYARQSCAYCHSRAKRESSIIINFLDAHFHGHDKLPRFLFGTQFFKRMLVVGFCFFMLVLSPPSIGAVYRTQNHALALRACAAMPVQTSRILKGPLLLTKQSHFYVVRQRLSVFSKPFQTPSKAIVR